MADEEQLKILRQGVEVWNAWRKEIRGVRVDLSKANLEGVDLCGFDLSHAHLEGANLNIAILDTANLSDTQLTKAKLSSASFLNANLAGAKLEWAIADGANLQGACLRDTDMMDAVLSWTNLCSADLTRAYLGGVEFHDTTLTNAIFQHAISDGAVFSNVDLSTALGLETVEHIGPSTIGIDTLYKSKGKIPESFLRGCGVPDSFITQVKALIGAEDGRQFYSCFISYSTLDEEFARRLYSRLQQEHVRVWFAPVDLRSGQKLHEQIDRAIQDFDKLLIVLSPNSLKSKWVMTELRKACKRERQSGKGKLFPLLLVAYETLRDWECFDADHGQDLATEVREYYIPDFSKWKDHDAFETEFAKLLKALRETDAKAAGMK